MNWRNIVPHAHEKQKLLIPRKKDRRIKLTPEQRIEIRENPEGLSNYKLAEKYGVSKRLVQFIRHPERQAKNLQDRHDRGGTMKYYDKEKHRETMKDHRQYKKELYDKNELVKSDSTDSQ